MSNQYIIYNFRAEIHATAEAELKRSSAVAKRPRGTTYLWKFCCHSKSLKVIRIYTIK